MREEGLAYKTHGGEAIEMSILRAALGRHLAGDGGLGGGWRALLGVQLPVSDHAAGEHHSGTEKGQLKEAKVTPERSPILTT